MTEQFDVHMPVLATLHWRPGRALRRVVAALLLVATLGAGLWYLTPTSLGGSTSYLVTRGTSMLPTHEPGALIVTRARDEYAVGDVIAFHHEGLHYLVMHRIVGIEGDRFITRGDNNAFDDAFRPAASDVVGTPWIHVPGGSEVAARIRSPLTQVVVFGSLAVFAFLTVRRHRSG